MPEFYPSDAIIAVLGLSGSVAYSWLVLVTWKRDLGFMRRVQKVDSRIQNLAVMIVLFFLLSVVVVAYGVVVMRIPFWWWLQIAASILGMIAVYSIGCFIIMSWAWAFKCTSCGRYTHFREPTEGGGGILHFLASGEAVPQDHYRTGLICPRCESNVDND